MAQKKRTTGAVLRNKGPTATSVETSSWTTNNVTKHSTDITCAVRGSTTNFFLAVRTVQETIIRNYWQLTSPKIRLIDLLIGTNVILTFLQILYRYTVGSFPFNSFLSGVFSTGGVAVLSVALRMQLMLPWEFRNITPERALVDFLVCCLVLFVGTITFLG